MRLFKGEVRQLTFDVVDSQGEDFTIGEATYVVKNGDRILDTGLMTVEGDKLSFMLNASEVGSYSVVIRYVIGLEIMRERFPIEVIEA